MSLDRDWIPRQSDSPRRRAGARLGVLAAGLLVACACWCQVRSGVAEELAAGSQASASQAAESRAEATGAPPDAPLPASLSGEPPAPVDMPTGADEPEASGPGPAVVAEKAVSATPATLAVEVVEAEAERAPLTRVPDAAVEHEGAKILASVETQPARPASQTEPVAEPGTPAKSEPGASPKAEGESPANPVREAVASVLRIVSRVEDTVAPRQDAQPAGPPEPLPAERKTAEPAASGEPPSAFETRPIGELTVNIGCRKGDLPTDFGRDQLARMQAKGRSTVFDRDWPTMGYCWDAPGLCHNPLYFEEVNLERYGYGPRYLRVAQPIISAGQFFVTVPILPYLMVAEPTRECVYTLGHYRPGSAVPYRIMLPPLNLKAATVEGGLIVGLIYLIP
jgi:hypothetical protein